LDWKEGIGMRWRDLQPRTIHFSERIPLRMLFRSPTSEEPRVNRFLKMGELLDFEFKAEQLQCVYTWVS